MSESNQNSISHHSLRYISELHKESLDWLSTLEFWKFELNFFQKLVDKNFLQVTFPDKMQQLKLLEKEIRAFNTERIEQLEIEIKKHEHYLNKIESGDSDADDVTYRKQHLQEAEKMNKSMKEFRALKKVLFNFIEHVTD